MSAFGMHASLMVWLSADRDAQSDVVVQLESLLSTQGFLKRVLASKSPHVRTAAYTLVAHICYRCSLHPSPR